MEFVRECVAHTVSIAEDIDLMVKVAPDYRSTLGGDRIAAAAGAWAAHAGEWLLVVDSGTAVTCDVVTPDGHFMGGNIAPGLKLSLDALHDHTALLPEVEVPTVTDSEFVGHDTVSAMIKGVVFGVVGAIESMSRRLGKDTRVIVTGGNSSLLMPLLDCRAEHHPNLVLDGLNRILLKNIEDTDTHFSTVSRL